MLSSQLSTIIYFPKRQVLPMTFEQIDYFICAAQSRTFFDAAEAMHISQSALSKQIMKLEKELDLVLWDRSKRSAVLTPAGEFFYKEALKISRQYHRSLEAVSHFKDSETQALHIGTLPFLSQYHLTSQIHSFCSAHPEIPFSLKEVEDQELLAGLENDHFQLVFIRKNMVDPKLYTFHLLTEDRLVAVLPAGHPLSAKTSLDLTELKRDPFILMPPHTSIYRLCMRSFHNAGIHPQILRTARAESIVSAVEIGEGISLLAESSFHLFRQPSLIAVPINGLDKLSIGIACKKNMTLTSSAECFLRFLESHK